MRKRLTAWETTWCLKDLISVKNLERKLLKLWHDHLDWYLLPEDQDGWVLLTKTTVLHTVKVVQSFLEESEVTNASRTYLSHRYQRRCCSHTRLVWAQGGFSKEWRQIHTCLKVTSHHSASHNIKGEVWVFASDWQTLIRLRTELTGFTLHKPRIKYGLVLIKPFLFTLIRPNQEQGCLQIMPSSH